MGSKGSIPSPPGGLCSRDGSRCRASGEDCSSGGQWCQDSCCSSAPGGGRRRMLAGAVDVVAAYSVACIAGPVWLLEGEVRPEKGMQPLWMERPTAAAAAAAAAAV